MLRKILAAATVFLLAASAGYAENVIDVLTSAVEAAVSGISNTVSNANPARIISDTTEGTVEAGQKAGEAAVGGVTNTAGVVSRAAE